MNFGSMPPALRSNWSAILNHPQERNAGDCLSVVASLGEGIIMSENLDLNLPLVPFEVLEFASENDIQYDLRGVAVLTRRVFPDEPLAIQLQVDESNPKLHQVVLVVIGTT